MNPLEREVEDLFKDLRAIENDARHATAPLPYARTDAHYASVSATFLAPNMTMQEPTWLNGGPDFHITRMTYAVWGGVTNTTTKMARLFDVGVGLSNTGLPGTTRDSAAVLTGPNFDFMWNMRKKSSQTFYGVGPGGLLSREVLGYPERGKMLEFTDGEGNPAPWKIKSGDGLVVRIQPTMWMTMLLSNSATPTTSTVITRISVHILAAGFRTAS